MHFNSFKKKCICLYLFKNYEILLFYFYSAETLLCKRSYFALFFPYFKVIGKRKYCWRKFFKKIKLEKIDKIDICRILWKIFHENNKSHFYLFIFISILFYISTNFNDLFKSNRRGMSGKFNRLTIASSIAHCSHRKRVNIYTSDFINNLLVLLIILLL